MHTHVHAHYMELGLQSAGITLTGSRQQGATEPQIHREPVLQGSGNPRGVTGWMESHLHMPHLHHS